MTVDEILASMPDLDVVANINDILVIDPSTRQINIPGSELIFGVTSDENAERKYFLCPRYVGNDLDLESCFIRINYRNANGDIDAHLIDDVALTEDGENITFSWELARKVTQFTGQVTFVVCACRPNKDGKLLNEWNTTQAVGMVLNGIEPTNVDVTGATTDVIAQLITMVERQTDAVEAEGVTQVAQVEAAAKAAETASVAEIEAKGVNVRESIPDDYTALSEAVDAVMRGKAPAIVCEATGSAVSVNDASDMVFQGMRIFGKSIQSGVPSPEAPVDIVSLENPVVTVTGKNLIAPTADSVTAQGITSTPASNGGTVILNGTATQEISRIVSQNFRLHPGKYTLSVKNLHMVDGNKDRVYLNAADNSGTIVNYIMSNKPVTFEITKSVLARAALVLASGSTYNNEVVSVQLEAGSAATAYEPYKTALNVESNHTIHGIPVTSGGNYTDENGQQWICDEVDLERGVYVQRVNRRVFDGTESAWRRGTLPTGEAMNYIYFADSTVHNVNLSICSHAVFAAGGGEWNKGGYMRSGTGYWQTITSMTLDEWKAYLGELTANGTPMVLYHVISNAVETPLSETEIAAYRALRSNYRNTTVLNSAGAHMAVKYVADTKLYIDNKIAALMGG